MNTKKKDTVLVVDNESDQLGMIKEMLSHFGFRAKTTDNPQQALQMVAKEPFSLVLMDLIMSDIDGTELCEAIKQIRSKACVYAMSGHLHLYRPDRLVSAGFDGTLGKPFSMEELKTVLDDAVVRRSQGGG